MTRSEARAIEESTGRILRSMSKTVNDLVGVVELEKAREIYEKIKPIEDEVNRIRDMAMAELTK